MDKIKKYLSVRAFSFLLFAIIPFSFSLAMFHACTSERETVRYFDHDEIISSRDNHYYYFPDQHIYYYPRNKQWMVYDNQAQAWLITQRAPKVFADGKRVKGIRMNYHGIMPYSIHYGDRAPY